MTTFERILNSRVILGSLLIAGAVVDIFLVGQAYGLNSSEWASWVQAIGSIAAICVAFWLARAERANARADALTLAIVTAVDMLYSANEAHGAVKAAIITLNRGAELSFPIEEMTKASNAIAHIGWWDPSQIAAILPLPNGCAMSMAKAQFLVAQARTVLFDSLQMTHLHHLHTLRENASTSAREYLRMADANMDAVLDVLNRAAKPAEFSFSRREP